MTDEKDYVERLEKIIDKQDALLSQLDSKFNQQDSLNASLAKQNKYLKEDIQKHKNLTRDMNKIVAQHKNVVAKLKKELEQQLKIQQDLHKDYGEVIKNLTDDQIREKFHSYIKNSRIKEEVLREWIDYCNLGEIFIFQNVSKDFIREFVTSGTIVHAIFGNRYASEDDAFRKEIEDKFGLGK